MLKSAPRKLIYTVLACILTLVSGLARADDTEIFFGGGTGATIRPNVLLILDTSGSMTTTVPCPPSCPAASRIQIMRNALVDILNGMEDVNVGLMRFTYQQGGAILYPIRYIDDPAASAASEPDDTTPLVNFVVTAGADDAEENLTIVTHPNTLTEPVLELGYIPAVLASNTVTAQVSNSLHDADEFAGNTDTTTFFWMDAGGGTQDGALFTGLNIPQGATITDARLELFPVDTTTGVNTTISGEAVDNATPFDNGGPDVSTRPKTTASVLFRSPGPIEAGTVGTAITSDNLASIIQEIVCRGVTVATPGCLTPPYAGGWTSGNSIALISHATSGGTRRFNSFDTNAAEAPRLTVTYTSTLSSAMEQRVGLRFPVVSVPQGVNIISAKLTFTANSTDGGDGLILSIRGDETITAGVLNSPAFTGANDDLDEPPRDHTGSSMDWTVPDMTAGGLYESVDIKNVVQEIVNHTEWCGGNAMSFFIRPNTSPPSPIGTRHIQAFEGNAAQAVKLEIKYDITGGPVGCYRGTETAQIATSSDDADQVSGSSTALTGDLDVAERFVGLRFQDIDIPQDATILSATISFTATGNTVSGSGNPTVAITGQAVDDAATFTTATNNISSTTTRPRTAASVNWTTGVWGVDNVVKTTPPLTTIVQEIVNRGPPAGWAAGNDMVFIFSDVGAQTRKAYSVNVNAAKAPRLTINYQASGVTLFKTVREKLLEISATLPAVDYTPITEVFYEAAHYWRGNSAVYGKVRNGQADTRISHPGTYCTGPGSCNLADTGTYPDFGVLYPAGCTDANLNSSNCINQSIQGTPDYISPFNPTLTCTKNYQVLLTDGLANMNEATATIRSEFLGGAACQTTKVGTDPAVPPSAVSSGELCSIDLVRNLNDNDQSSIINGTQAITTYTIGFNTATLAGANQFLQDVATAGDGAFFNATDAASLVGVFESILADVKNDPTAFVAPTIATNQFNQLLSRDTLYFGMFTPQLEQAWLGNMKKYQLCLDTDTNNDGTPECTFADVLDGNLDPAIDPTDDQFKTTAQSFWSNVPDGRETTEGGAGEELTDFTTRIVYTEVKDQGAGTVVATSGTSLDGAGFKLTSANWDNADLAAIRNQVCPTPSTAAASDCENRMLFMLGKDFDPDDTIDPSATTRWPLNDVLHSAPAVMTYGGTDNFKADGTAGTDGVIDTFFDKVYFGTNEGGLHMVNGETGVEEWVFMPESVLSNQPTIFTNAEGAHLYGIDLPPALRIIDNDNDAQIEPANGDKVHLFAGMRSGGDFYYALDITPASTITNNSVGNIVPKFLWRIQGGAGAYTRMGDTWSQPRVATIRTTGSPMTVLIFAGGYDNALENAASFGTAATGGADNLGNAIFIIDADTGAKLLSISGTGSGADIIEPNMHFSITSEVTVFDNDGDGFDDRIYVGDTGGQVWRVDLGADIKPSGGLLTSETNKTIVGRLAAISNHATSPAVPADQRRFFHRPAVVQVKDNIFSDAANGEFDYVFIGSGYRSHPLNIAVDDRIYAFRDRTIGKMTGGGGGNANLALGYPAKSGTSSIPAGPISHANLGDLVDVTATVLSSGNTTHVQSTGWFFDFQTDPTAINGEKVLAAARILAGTAFFTSFQPPSAGTDLCLAQIGASRLFNFNVLTSAASLDWDGDGTIDSDDRSKFGGVGIISEGVPVYTEEGVLLVHTAGAGLTTEQATTGVPRFRTYWHD